jgi:class 3 adenylate cyclase
MVENLHGRSGKVGSVGGPLLVGDGMSDAVAHAFALPTGTVTFLLTDVEGSTKGWEANPQHMAAAIARHYEILDEAIAVNGGVRPVEQGEGDSVVAAFSRASDAVTAALAAQLALHAEPWPGEAALGVRMAIHTGEAQLRNEGNYFGQTVIRTARLRAIGHGGQILVSDATASLVADRSDADSSLVDLGVHRLKDLGRPERVWQVRHRDLPTTFPALVSLDSFRHNLPSRLTPLVGRQAEVRDAVRELGDARLLTLAGSGGIGKTRLALAVGAEVLDRFPGGVWWAELAPIHDASAIEPAVLAAVGARTDCRCTRGFSESGDAGQLRARDRNVRQIGGRSLAAQSERDGAGHVARAVVGAR